MAVNKNCKYCGKPFVSIGGSRFCSDTCRGAASRESKKAINARYRASVKARQTNGSHPDI